MDLIVSRLDITEIFCDEVVVASAAQKTGNDNLNYPPYQENDGANRGCA
jgi:hypothetical protein